VKQVDGRKCQETPAVVKHAPRQWQSSETQRQEKMHGNGSTEAHAICVGFEDCMNF